MNHSLESLGGKQFFQSNVFDYLKEIFRKVTITNNIITIKEQFEREAWDILAWQELESELHHIFYDY